MASQYIIGGPFSGASASVNTIRFGEPYITGANKGRLKLCVYAVSSFTNPIRTGAEISVSYSIDPDGYFTHTLTTDTHGNTIIEFVRTSKTTDSKTTSIYSDITLTAAAIDSYTSTSIQFRIICASYNSYDYLGMHDPELKNQDRDGYLVSSPIGQNPYPKDLAPSAEPSSSRTLYAATNNSNITTTNADLSYIGIVGDASDYVFFYSYVQGGSVRGGQLRWMTGSGPTSLTQGTIILNGQWSNSSYEYTTYCDYVEIPINVVNSLITTGFASDKYPITTIGAGYRYLKSLTDSQIEDPSTNKFLLICIKPEGCKNRCYVNVSGTNAQYVGYTEEYDSDTGYTLIKIWRKGSYTSTISVNILFYNGNGYIAGGSTGITVVIGNTTYVAGSDSSTTGTGVTVSAPSEIDTNSSATLEISDVDGISNYVLGNVMVGGPGAEHVTLTKGDNTGTAKYTIATDSSAQGDLNLYIVSANSSNRLGTYSKTLTIKLGSTTNTRVYLQNEWKKTQPKVYYNGEWRDATAYIYSGGEWKKA